MPSLDPKDSGGDPPACRNGGCSGGGAGVGSAAQPGPHPALFFSAGPGRTRADRERPRPAASWAARPTWNALASFRKMGSFKKLKSSVSRGFRTGGGIWRRRNLGPRSGQVRPQRRGGGGPCGQVCPWARLRLRRFRPRGTGRRPRVVPSGRGASVVPTAWGDPPPRPEPLGRWRRGAGAASTRAREWCSGRRSKSTDSLTFLGRALSEGSLPRTLAELRGRERAGCPAGR